MSLLTQALQDINYWIENSKSWHADWIRSYGVRPGLEREMIELYSEEYNFQFSEEVYELYQWHGGGIPVGDYANPIFFQTLDQAVASIVTGQFPCLPYIGLFRGDGVCYVTPEASDGQKTSPIFAGDGFISNSESSRLDFYDKRYAPSVTCLMQAIAECAKTYDGISAMHMDYSPSEIYPNYPRIGRSRSVLSQIYDKYGVVGDSSGIWR